MLYPCNQDVSGQHDHREPVLQLGPSGLCEEAGRAFGIQNNPYMNRMFLFSEVKNVSDKHLARSGFNKVRKSTHFSSRT